MEGRGWKGGFGDKAAPPTRQAFLDNYKKMVAEEENMKAIDLKIARAEKGTDLSGLQLKKSNCTKALVHFKSLVARQTTVPGFYKEARQEYLDKLREHETNANELFKLTGEKVQPYKTDVIPITIAMLGNDLMRMGVE